MRTVWSRMTKFGRMTLGGGAYLTRHSIRGSPMLHIASWWAPTSSKFSGPPIYANTVWPRATKFDKVTCGWEAFLAASPPRLPPILRGGTPALPNFTVLQLLCLHPLTYSMTKFSKVTHMGEDISNMSTHLPTSHSKGRGPRTPMFRGSPLLMPTSDGVKRPNSVW